MLQALRPSVCLSHAHMRQTVRFIATWWLENTDSKPHAESRTHQSAWPNEPPKVAKTILTLKIYTVSIFKNK